MAMVLLVILTSMFSLSSFAAKSIELECYPIARCRDVIVTVNKLNMASIENPKEIKEALKLIGLDKDVRYINIDEKEKLFNVYVEKSPLLRKVDVKSSDIDKDLILKLSQLLVKILRRLFFFLRVEIYRLSDQGNLEKLLKLVQDLDLKLNFFLNLDF